MANADAPFGECEKCGEPMVRREGRRGPFIGCSSFPSCHYTKPVQSAEAPTGGVDHMREASRAPRREPPPHALPKDMEVSFVHPTPMPGFRGPVENWQGKGMFVESGSCLALGDDAPQPGCMIVPWHNVLCFRYISEEGR